MNLEWMVVWEHRERFLEGAAMTIFLTVATMAISIPGGLTLAFLRMSRFGLVRAPTMAFVEFFRATPLILQVYWVFYVLPASVGWRLSALETGLAALAMNVSSFNSETFRAGILSIRPGQRHAALALGMSGVQVMWYVVLPQAISRVLPALASTWVSLFKDTSLVSTITVMELSYVSLQIRSQTFRVLEVLTAMAALYWLMGYPQAKLVDWIHRRWKVAE
jgi:His/Glu/Gln/Arg/opine family amino acid ABC transporter permease subunit